MPSPDPRHQPASTAERVFQLSGAAPLAAFLVLHLVDVSRALAGRRAFSAAVDRARWETALEIVLVWLPLVFHVGYGARRRPSPARPRLDRGLAWAAVAFVVVHAYHVRLPVALGQRTRDELFTELTASLSTTGPLGIPTWASLYVIGLFATAYHFAQGSQRALEYFRGRAPSSRQRTALRALAVLAFVWGLNAIVYFATGSRLIWLPPSGLWW